MALPRTEFGYPRPADCACSDCRLNCRHMPGQLVPADLARIIPPDLPALDKIAWIEAHLRASPEGAIVMARGELYSVQVLTLATKDDGSCVFLTDDEPRTIAYDRGRELAHKLTFRRYDR